MKNKLLIAVGLSLASVCASAQNYFGVTGGCNLSHLSKQDILFDFYSKIGFNVGVAYEHRFKNSGNSYPFVDASILYSLEQYSFAYKDRTIDPYDMVLYYGGYEPIVKEKYLKVPVGVGFNFQLAEKFGLAPKVYGILDATIDRFGMDPIFAFGGGMNLNIGEQFQIGIGYDLNHSFSWSCVSGKDWIGNFHANLTYYIFSK